LYVPKILNTSPQDYQKHFTNFSIYRTKDLLNRYKIEDEPDKFNNPNEFIWCCDLRVCAAFYGKYVDEGSYYYFRIYEGQIEDYDVGSVFEFEDGSRFEIIQIVSDFIIYLTPVTSVYTVSDTFTATAIGNGKVFRVTQSGYTVSRTHGATFNSDDINKPVKFADGSWDYITEYISPNQIKVTTSQTRSTTGMTMDCVYRYFNDTTLDEVLDTRLTRSKLKQRFWQPLPNSNIGKVTPGLIFIGGENLNYGQTPDTFEYLHGFYDPSYQITKVIKEAIQGMWLFQNVLTIWTRGKTWRWQTSGYQFIVNPFTKDSVLQITGLDVSDEDKGLFDIGSIEPVGDGSIMLWTYESGQICCRRYNGYQYGPDEFLSQTGIERIPDIQNLDSTTVAIYDGLAGMLFYGKE
jgi:hypothetical protein